MRIAQRVFEGRDNADATVGLRQHWAPVLGAAPRHDGGDRADGGARIAPIADQLRRKSARRREREPDLLLQRAARDKLAVPGGIELVARRAAGEPSGIRSGELAGGGADRERVE